MPSLLMDGTFERLSQASFQSGALCSSDDFRVTPGMPPLVPCAICLWIAAAFSYSFLFDLGEDFLQATIAIFLLVTVLSCIALAIRRRPFFSFVLFTALGIAIGSMAAYAYIEDSKALPEDGECMLVLQDDPRKSARGSYATGECILENGRSVKVKAFFNEEIDCYNRARLRARCTFSESNEEYARSDYMSGITMQVNVVSYQLEQVPFPENLVYEVRGSAVRAIELYGAEESGLLQALLCGYRPTIQDQGAYDAFKRCGTAHMIAVSGAHLSIISMTFASLLKLLRLKRPVFVCMNVLLIFAYLVFAGVPISAMRAAIMCALSLVSTLAKRRNAVLNSLAICVIGFLVTDPASSVSVSLFLSAASTFAIVSLSGLFSSWASDRSRITRDFFAAPLALTISSNIATLPFSASLFGIVPMVSPLANVAMAPLFTLCCVVGVVCLAVALIVPFFAPLALGMASVCASPLSHVAQLMSALPNSTIEVELEPVAMLLLSGVIVFALLLFKPKVPKGWIIGPFVLLCAFFALSSITIPGNDENKIVMLDVGQGDAFIVQSRGRTLLIDTGNEDEELADSLRYAGITEIDAVSISHSDSDHCDSLESIGILSENAAFICAADMLVCPCSKCKDLVSEAKRMFGPENVKGLDVGDAFTVGDFSLEVVWPRSYTDDGGNCDSVCLLATLDSNGDGETDWKALFTGDAEAEELGAILKEKDVGDIDVLKVGHHGSRKSIDSDIVAALDPEFSLISAGVGNSYGHPTEDALDALASVDSRISRTDENGVVELDFLSTGIKVVEQKHG